jgi:2-polyprenyl-3-methyl-5-hydroxy-6-metoxy-1,4-benzoquinol methylase
MFLQKYKSNRFFPAASWVWHTFVPGVMRERFWKSYFDRSNRGHYQQIRFGGKTFVKGKDRSALYKQLFPVPPKGKSMLDVGSNLGYYSLMAIHEGASYCKAIEMDEWYANECKDVAAELGISNLEVVNADIFDVSLDKESFDIVICLNLIHHFETIERVEEVLDKLYDTTREVMMLTVIVPDDRSLMYTVDEAPNVDGERLVRISPHYFLNKYGNGQVRIMEANLYFDRYVITVTKGKFDKKDAVA